MVMICARKSARFNTPSTRPRIDVVAMSAVQALNAASLAVDPKKVITASAMTTMITARLVVWM